MASLGISYPASSFSCASTCSLKSDAKKLDERSGDLIREQRLRRFWSFVQMFMVIAGQKPALVGKFSVARNFSLVGWMSLVISLGYIGSQLYWVTDSARGFLEALRTQGVFKPYTCFNFIQTTCTIQAFLGPLNSILFCRRGHPLFAWLDGRDIQISGKNNTPSEYHSIPTENYATETTY